MRKVKTVHLVTTKEGKKVAAKLEKLYGEWSEVGADPIHMYPPSQNNVVSMTACTAAGDALLSFAGYVDEFTHMGYTPAECVVGALENAGHEEVPQSYNAAAIAKHLLSKGWVKKKKHYIDAEDLEGNAIK